MNLAKKGAAYKMSFKSSYANIRKIYKLIVFNRILMKKRRSVRALKNKKDFSNYLSNNIIIAALLLLIVISIVSIAFYLYTLNRVKPQFIVNEGKATGEVAITITATPSELAVSPNDSNLNNQ